MKRLLCFFDGTWNSRADKDELTNVVKLYNAVPETDASGVRQIAHYEIGIATKENFGRLTFAAGALGVGVADRIQSGLKFLVENYEPGDEIYIFGFSRGAFQARSLGGLITLTGLLKSAAVERIPELWDYYQSHKAAPNDAILAGIRSDTHAARIRCIGVWETVGNLGVPLVRRGHINRALAFHGTGLSPQVDVGLHALSIDEPRKSFSPTFWTKRKGETLPAGQIIEQVWFPGCHANVGGGYKDCGLSDISLLWMAERAMATTGVGLDFDTLRRDARPDPLAEAVQPTSDTVFRVSQVVPYVRLIHQNPRGISPWRRSVLGTWRSSKLPPDEEVVNETIHPSAGERFGRRVKLRRGLDVAAVVYKPRQLKLEFTKARSRKTKPTP